jgi:hypothetical protein
MKRTVTVVRGDDWSGLYIDGVLVEEGHRLGVEDVLEVVRHLGPFDVETVDADQEWLESEGNLPKLLGEVRS